MSRRNAKNNNFDAKKSSIKLKVISFFNRVVKIADDKSKGIIKYDIDNKFPQNLIKQLMESGTATSCIERLDQFIYANGFVNEEVGKTKVNDKQTFNELASEQSYYSAAAQATVWYVMRKPDGTVGSSKAIPWENTRKTLDGNYIVNETYSCDKYDDKKDVTYPAYRGTKITPAELAEHIRVWGADKGEIYYYFKKKPLRRDYPIPSYYSGISDIDTDAENSKFELESVNNSFLTSGVYTTVGEIDSTTKDERGYTDMDYHMAELQKFSGESKNEKGETGRLKMLFLNAPTKDQIGTFQPISNEGVFNAIENSTKRVAAKVARVFNVPPFLIGLEVSTGLSTNFISDSIKLFNDCVSKNKDLITEPLSNMFPGIDFTLTNHDPIKYIDPSILADLTPAERRQLAGYATEETKSTSTISLAQSLGVGSTTSLIDVLKDTTLTPDQKLNTLMILFNLSEENAKKLVPQTPTTTA